MFSHEDTKATKTVPQFFLAETQRRRDFFDRILPYGVYAVKDENHKISAPLRLCEKKIGALFLRVLRAFV